MTETEAETNRQRQDETPEDTNSTRENVEERWADTRKDKDISRTNR